MAVPVTPVDESIAVHGMEPKHMLLVLACVPMVPVDASTLAAQVVMVCRALCCRVTDRRVDGDEQSVRGSDAAGDGRGVQHTHRVSDVVLAAQSARDGVLQAVHVVVG